MTDLSDLKTLERDAFRKFYEDGLVLYGFLFGLPMPLLAWPRILWGISVPAWAALGIPGVVIVSIGLYKLSRFLGNWPPLPTGEEPLHGGR